MSDAAPRPSWWRRTLARLGRWAGRYSAFGLAGALAFFATALGPALIPRSPLFQGLAAGICAAIGYGLGVLLAWVLRLAGVRWPARVVHWGWRLLLAATIVTVPVALVVSTTWQDDLRDLFGMEHPSSAHSITILVLALLIAIGLVGLGRALRRLTHLVGRLVGRWIPPVVARLTAVAVVALAVVLLVNGTIVQGGMAALNSIYGSVDDTTAEGVVQPTDPLRSGSDASLAAWDELGKQGRTFVAGGRPEAQLEAVAARTGATKPVMDPIRVYAGLQSGDDLDAIAQVVVAELDRTHAWDRSVLAVVTATGTGWVDPSMADSLELLWGGDTAIASMQYSYLPSWVSFLGARSTPPAAGKALFEAIYARWSQLPEDDRPLLEVAGISLGSFGSQGAFSSLQDVTARTDGALWMGTPGFTPLWGDLTAHRDAGSPEITPVVDGGATARWANRPGEGDDRQLWQLGTSWQQPRVVFDQHASDGVTWWSPDLILHRPDWLAEPRGTDVLDSTTWLPVVTFWRSTIDLFVAASVPAGHGHNYHQEYADGWAAIAPPEGWTEPDTDVLREVVGSVASES
ncbi:alpha/beta-hydrolase family protein [Cellulomonas sp. PhB150]|uniref:alpha/beta hydrolase n=1 Tax=Cellulomonas sp. PhB150 TaxID=2485188 RepID=UPI000F4A704A|nr:alpha/beta-hydrolase family protein [Cellulomonas sp. PhB150]ROS31074.1 putative membrane protein [Cellulomonas sp. PhB150]